jgi:hypothetical protein
VDDHFDFTDLTDALAYVIVVPDPETGQVPPEGLSIHTTLDYRETAALMRHAAESLMPEVENG